MGAAGRERAIAEFSWDSIAEQTLSIYETVCATG
jgi:starch synthase